MLAGIAAGLRTSHSSGTQKALCTPRGCDGERTRISARGASSRRRPVRPLPSSVKLERHTSAFPSILKEFNVTEATGTQKRTACKPRVTCVSGYQLTKGSKKQNKQERNPAVATAVQSQSHISRQEDNCDFCASAMNYVNI